MPSAMRSLQPSLMAIDTLADLKGFGERGAGDFDVRPRIAWRRNSEFEFFAAAAGRELFGKLHRHVVRWRGDENGGTPRRLSDAPKAESLHSFDESRKHRTIVGTSLAGREALA